MDVTVDDIRAADLNTFINERESVRVKKESGQPPPWTTDPILQNYKFCNVHREDDKTTRWLAANWRDNHADDPDLWFAMVIARRALNWPDSMEELGYPVPWDPQHFIDFVHSRHSDGRKTYDTAYQLLVQGRKGDKAENLVQYVLDPLWAKRAHIRPGKYAYLGIQDNLMAFFSRLSDYKYMGSFYSGQVVADLKYAQLKYVSDWDSFAVPGPGSERGLNRVFKRDKNARWGPGEWYEAIEALHPMIETLMHRQDLQNCLCEFDKYERARLNEGRVRPYKGNGQTL